MVWPRNANSGSCVGFVVHFGHSIDGQSSTPGGLQEYYLGIPKPKYFYDMSGFWVEFRKDVFDMEYLKSLGLNERQIQAIKFVKVNGKITNSEYQANYGVARNTATRDLSELVAKGILKSSETKGAGSYYEF